MEKEPKVSPLPSLDDKCGAHFRFKDLIQCGETYHGLGIDNIPREAQTYLALKRLTEEILDPLVNEFGKIELTYGVSCSSLSRAIKRNICPSLDQHSSFERNKNGHLICKRGGAAADVCSPNVGSLTLSQWIVRQREFDRLYYYGDQRPFHISLSAENYRHIVIMRRSEITGRRIPKRISNDSFLMLKDDSKMSISGR